MSRCRVNIRQEAHISRRYSKSTSLGGPYSIPVCLAHGRIRQTRGRCRANGFRGRLGEIVTVTSRQRTTNFGGILADGDVLYWIEALNKSRLLRIPITGGEPVGFMRTLSDHQASTATNNAHHSEGCQPKTSARPTSALLAEDRGFTGLDSPRGPFCARSGRARYCR